MVRVIDLCPSIGKRLQITHIIPLRGPLFFCSIWRQSQCWQAAELHRAGHIITASEEKSKELMALLHGCHSGYYWEALRNSSPLLVPQAPPLHLSDTFLLFNFWCSPLAAYLEYSLENGTQRFTHSFQLATL